VRLEDLLEGVPAEHRIPLATDARVEHRKLGHRAGQHQPVHAAEQPQRQRRRPGIVLVPEQHRYGLPAELVVIGNQPEQLAIHRRPELIASIGLLPDPLHHPHPRNPSSPEALNKVWLR
jgi:hypothetical protein